MTAVKRSPLTTRQLVASAIRFFSSAGNGRSQRTFGTTPNMAPPSSRKAASRTIETSSVPRRMGGILCAVAYDPPDAPPLFRHEGLRRGEIARAFRALGVHGRAGGLPASLRLRPEPQGPP